MKLSSAFCLCLLATALFAQPLHTQTRDSLTALKRGTLVRLFADTRRIDGTWSSLHDSSVVIQHAGLARVLPLSAIDSIAWSSGARSGHSGAAMAIGTVVGLAASLVVLAGSCIEEACSTLTYVAIPAAFTGLGVLGGAAIAGKPRVNSSEHWLIVYRKSVPSR